MNRDSGTTAAALLVECLENEGVEYIFGVPGEENIDILDALLDRRIKFVTTRHEQGAAFMADVYGRLTGRAGVCVATLGPGATNLITGFADANMDRAPMLVLTGSYSTTSKYCVGRISVLLFTVIDTVFVVCPGWNVRVPASAP